MNNRLNILKTKILIKNKYLTNFRFFYFKFVKRDFKNFKFLKNFYNSIEHLKYFCFTNFCSIKNISLLPTLRLFSYNTFKFLNLITFFYKINFNARSYFTLNSTTSKIFIIRYFYFNNFLSTKIQKLNYSVNYDLRHLFYKHRIKRILEKELLKLNVGKLNKLRHNSKFFWRILFYKNNIKITKKFHFFKRIKFLTKKTLPNNKRYLFQNLTINNRLKITKNNSSKSNTLLLYVQSKILDKKLNTFHSVMVFFSKHELLFLLNFSPFLFKLFFFKLNNFKKLTETYLNEEFFFLKNFLLKLNIFPQINNFNYLLKKRIIKLFSINKFKPFSIFWMFTTLIKFLEFCSGKKTIIQFNPYIDNSLSLSENTKCLIWSKKLKYFRKVLGPRLFLNEAVRIFYLALKLKDPYFLINWLTAVIYKISFWKYKTFLRFIKYLCKNFLWPEFEILKVKGIKYQLKGKISVAGNARTRTSAHTIGKVSFSKKNNKILYNLKLIRTFTGVLGFKLWIVF